MSSTRFSQMLVLAVAAAAISCRDGSAPPTASENVRARAEVRGGSQLVMAQETFTVRGSLDPYRIHRLPDFMMHSTAESDIVMQRSIFPVGPGGWHTHPGPSFVYVIEGEVKLEHYSSKTGCSETAVHTAGSAYIEEGEGVHRAVVVSAIPAVVLVTRFNVPVGAPFSTPAPDPGC